MRILEIDRGGDELVQGFVRAEWPQRASIAGGAASAWIKMFLRSASLWSQAKPLSASVRIAIEPGRPVTTVHSFVVAKPSLPDLQAPARVPLPWSLPSVRHEDINQTAHSRALWVMTGRGARVRAKTRGWPMRWGSGRWPCAAGRSP